MIIVKLQGGLGNQMFQYAIGRALSLKKGDLLKMDTTFLLDRTSRKNFVYRDYDLNVFRIKPKFTFLSNTSKIFRIPFFIFAIDYIFYKIQNKIGRIKYINESKFDKNSFSAKNQRVYLDGYWQSEKYFKDFEDTIRKDFVFRDKLDDEAILLADKIKSSESVCINVRRGDYVHNAASAQFHGFLGLEYYKRGIEYISQKIDKPHFFITSDDIKWCKENLTNLLSNYDYTFVEHKHKGRKFAQYLHLMTMCKHHIIANSSFAWWGAWLGETKDGIIIAPKKWFNAPKETSDLIPDDWRVM